MVAAAQRQPFPNAAQVRFAGMKHADESEHALSAVNDTVLVAWRFHHDSP
jgi:hypothetical protein